MYRRDAAELDVAREQLVGYSARLLADGVAVGSAGDLSAGGPAGARPLGRVAVLGAHIVDVLGWPVESIPPGQGSARLEQIRVTAAGTAAGTAVDLAKLGADVLAIGAVGDDLLADLLTAELRRHGIDTSGLVRKPADQTSATILPIRPNGERPALHVPGATASLEPADIDLTAVSDVRALLLGAPDALGPIAAALPAVVSAARAGGAIVVVDVLRQGSTRDLERIGGLVGTADWFCPNGDQLCALTGHGDPVNAMKDILALGTGAVAATLGADGALVATAGAEPVHLPAIAVDVVDTTGCGDAFTAGLMAGLLLGCDHLDAAWLGMACGALVATGLGSDAGITDIAQVLRFLRAAEPEVASRISTAFGPAVVTAADH